MLVLDANILFRAVLGLLRKYTGRVGFMAPDLAFEEAREHLPGIVEGRGGALAGPGRGTRARLRDLDCRY